MPRDKKIRYAYSLAFILCECVLLVLIETTGGRANDVISFLSIVLAFLFGASHFFSGREYVLLSLALATTVLADWFLVMENPEIRLPAMISFSVTQICYFLSIYFAEDSPRVRLIHLSVRMPLFLLSILLTFAVLGEGADAVSVISVSYFANLICNVLFAFISFKRRPVMAVGLLLFLLCDVFVGFSVLGEYLTVSEGTFAYFLAHPGFNAAWLFYVPAQTLLGLNVMIQHGKQKAE